MLPFRTDVAMAPMIVANPGQAPRYPEVETSRFNHLLPLISATIVNMTCEKAGKNSLRMFFFNTISSNNWVNPTFEEVFMLVLTQIETALSRGASSPESVLESAVDSTIGLYSSGLVFVFDELRYLITPKQLESASKNAGLLHEVRKEMQRVYRFQPQNQQPMFQHPQQGYPQGSVWDPRTNTYVNASLPSVPVCYIDPRYGGNNNIPTHQFQAGFQQPGNYQAFGTIRQDSSKRVYNNDRYIPKQETPAAIKQQFERAEYRSHRAHVNNESREPEDFSLYQGDHFKHPAQPTHEKYEPEVFSTALNKQDIISEPTTSNDDISGVQLVDKQRHAQVVGYSQGLVLMPDEQRRFEVAQEDEQDVTVISTISVDNDLPTVIGQFRADMVKSPDFPICRKFLCVPEIIVSLTSVKERLSEWFTGVSLSATAIKMLEAMSYRYETQEVAARVLTTVREIDHCLKRKVNDFLAYSLEQPNITIGSFVEDYPDLRDYILKKFGGNGVELIDIFDRNLTTTLANQEVKELLDKCDWLELSAGVHVGYVPTMYTLTLVPVDRVALGLTAKSKKMVLSPEENKMAYAAVSKLFDNDDPENDIGVDVEIHLLVTRDGVKYRVCKEFEGKGIYVIQV